MTNYQLQLRTNYNLRIKVEDIHHVKVDKLVDECFQAIGINFICVRRLAKKHEVSLMILFGGILDKI